MSGNSFFHQKLIFENTKVHTNNSFSSLINFYLNGGFLRFFFPKISFKLKKCFQLETPRRFKQYKNKIFFRSAIEFFQTISNTQYNGSIFLIQTGINFQLFFLVDHITSLFLKNVEISFQKILNQLYYHLGFYVVKKTKKNSILKKKNVTKIFFSTLSFLRFSKKIIIIFFNWKFEKTGLEIYQKIRKIQNLIPEKNYYCFLLRTLEFYTFQFPRKFFRKQKGFSSVSFVKKFLKKNGDIFLIEFLFSGFSRFRFKFPVLPKAVSFLVQKIVENFTSIFSYLIKKMRYNFYKPFNVEQESCSNWDQGSVLIPGQKFGHPTYSFLTKQFLKRSLQKIKKSKKKINTCTSFTLREIQKFFLLVSDFQLDTRLIFDADLIQIVFSNLAVGYHIIRNIILRILTTFSYCSFFQTFASKSYFIFENGDRGCSSFSQIEKFLYSNTQTFGKIKTDIQQTVDFLLVVGFSKTRLQMFNFFFRRIKNRKAKTEKKKNNLFLHCIFFDLNWSYLCFFLKNFLNEKNKKILTARFLDFSTIAIQNGCTYILSLKKELEKNTRTTDAIKPKKKLSSKNSTTNTLIYETSELCLLDTLQSKKERLTFTQEMVNNFFISTFKRFVKEKHVSYCSFFSFFKELLIFDITNIITDRPEYHRKKRSNTISHYCSFCFFEILKSLPIVPCKKFVKKKKKVGTLRLLEKFFKNNVTERIFQRFFLSNFFSFFQKKSSFLEKKLKLNLDVLSDSFVSRYSRLNDLIPITFFKFQGFLRGECFSISIRLRTSLCSFFVYNVEKNLQNNKIHIFRQIMRIFRFLVIFKDPLFEILLNTKKYKVYETESLIFLEPFTIPPLKRKNCFKKEHGVIKHILTATRRVNWGIIFSNKLNLIIPSKNLALSSMFSFYFFKKLGIEKILKKKFYPFLKKNTHTVFFFSKIKPLFLKVVSQNQIILGGEDCIPRKIITTFENFEVGVEKKRLESRKLILFSSPQKNTFDVKIETKLLDHWFPRKLKKSKSQLKVLFNSIWIIPGISFENESQFSALQFSFLSDFLFQSYLGDFSIYFFLTFLNIFSFFGQTTKRYTTYKPRTHDFIFIEKKPLIFRITWKSNVLKILDGLVKKRNLFSNAQHEIFLNFSSNGLFCLKSEIFYFLHKRQKKNNKKCSHLINWINAKEEVLYFTKNIHSGILFPKSFSFLFIILMQIFLSNLDSRSRKFSMSVVRSFFMFQTPFFFLKWLNFQQNFLKNFSLAKNTKCLLVSNFFFHFSYFFPENPVVFFLFKRNFKGQKEIESGIKIAKKIFLGFFRKEMVFFSTNKNYSGIFLFIYFGFLSKKFLNHKHEKTSLLLFFHPEIFKKKQGMVKNNWGKIFFNLSLNSFGRSSFRTFKIFLRKIGNPEIEFWLRIKFSKGLLLNLLSDPCFVLKALKGFFNEIVLLFERFGCSGRIYSFINTTRNSLKVLQTFAFYFGVYTSNSFFFSLIFKFFISSQLIDKEPEKFFFRGRFLTPCVYGLFNNFSKKLLNITALSIFYLNSSEQKKTKYKKKLTKGLNILEVLIKNIPKVQKSFLEVFLIFFEDNFFIGNKIFLQFQKINILILEKIPFFFFFFTSPILTLSYRKIIELIGEKNQLYHKHLNTCLKVFFKIFSKIPNNFIPSLGSKLEIILMFSQETLKSKNQQTQAFGVSCIKNIIDKLPKKKIRMETIARISFLGIFNSHKNFEENSNILILTYLFTGHSCPKFFQIIIQFYDRCLYLRNTRVRTKSFFFLLKIVLLFKKKTLVKNFPRIFFSSLFRFFSDSEKVCSFLSGFISKTGFSKINFELFLLSYMKISLIRETEKKLYPIVLFFNRMVLFFSQFTKTVQIRFFSNFLIGFPQKTKGPKSFSWKKIFLFWKFLRDIFLNSKWIVSVSVAFSFLIFRFPISEPNSYFWNIFIFQKFSSFFFYNPDNENIITLRKIVNIPGYNYLDEDCHEKTFFFKIKKEKLIFCLNVFSDNYSSLETINTGKAELIKKCFAKENGENFYNQSGSFDKKKKLFLLSNWFFKFFHIETSFLIKKHSSLNLKRTGFANVLLKKNFGKDNKVLFLKILKKTLLSLFSLHLFS